MSKLHITVWEENLHEQTQPDVRARYPEGRHGAIAAVGPGHPIAAGIPNPVYFPPEVRQVLANAARWAAPERQGPPTGPLQSRDRHVPKPGWFLEPAAR